MLIEIWERLRGYDKWIPAEAYVYPATEIRKKLGKRYQISPESQFSGELLVWLDDYEQAHVGTFVPTKHRPSTSSSKANPFPSFTTPQSRIATTAAPISLAGLHVSPRRSLPLSSSAASLAGASG